MSSRWWFGVCQSRYRLRTHHAFKYRLAFVRDGKRIVGYDIERGKGDHKHLRDREMAYRFVDVDALVLDFLEDVEAMK